MSENKTYDDPTNRIVCIFDDQDSAAKAQATLAELGFEPQRMTLLHGDADASEVDTSAKWFADTDVKMKKIQRELHDGSAVLSVQIDDKSQKDKVLQALKDNGARQITHFGEWVTEVM